MIEQFKFMSYFETLYHLIGYLTLKLLIKSTGFGQVGHFRNSDQNRANSQL